MVTQGGVLRRVGRWLALAGAFLLASCALHPGPQYQSIPEASAGYARIVIFRLPTLASGYQQNFWMNGRLVTHLDLKGYTHFLVKPGMHEIHAGPAVDYRVGMVQVNAMPGKTYYLQYSTTPGPMTLAGPTPVLTGPNRAFLREVSEGEAKARLPGFGFQPPEVEKVE